MFGGCCLLLVASFVDFIVLSTTNLVSTKQPFMLSASYSHTKCLNGVGLEPSMHRIEIIGRNLFQKRK